MIHVLPSEKECYRADRLILPMVWRIERHSTDKSFLHGLFWLNLQYRKLLPKNKDLIL